MHDDKQSGMAQTLTQDLLEVKTPELSICQSADKTSPLVSAIVSTYNAERLIRGCLEDLEAQTIADRLEIIVVDSGSQQNEWAIVKEFQQRYDNIVYLRTAKREGVYTAWNRGIQAASGKYITNANTDDRHKQDAFERMAAVLEARPDIALVYANVYVNKTENETFENHTRVGAYRWPDFDPVKLIYKSYIGPQPVWRKSMHEKYGYFDESFASAGDREFWLRMAGSETFFHLDEFLGLFLKTPTSVSHRYRGREAQRVYQRYVHRLAHLKAAQSVTSTPNAEATNREATLMNPLLVLNDLKVGQRVKVKGELSEDGAFVALEIDLESSVNTSIDEAVIEGVIRSIGQQSNTLRLLNREFVLLDGIEINDLQRHIISLKDLRAGDGLKLKGKYSELKGFAPDKIKIKEMIDFNIGKLQGHINKIDRTKKTLEVVGFTVMVDEYTMIFLKVCK